MSNHISSDSKIVHIGFDDTDSAEGRCTTNLAFKTVSSLRVKRILSSSIIHFLRLNPNIPWKTRGNGAICLRIKTDHPSQIIEYMVKILRTEPDMANGASPGLAIFEGDNIPLSLRQFSNRAMYDVIKMEEAEKLASQLSIQIFKYGKGLGIIGAIASIGSFTEGDHTYEAIAYRKEEYHGSTRKIDKSKVSKINIDTYPFTF